MSTVDNRTMFPIGVMPNQAVENYTDSDYRKSISFLASKWNTQQSTFTLTTQFQGNSPIAASVELTKGLARRYVEDLAYFTGSQIQSDYSFFVHDEYGNDTRVPMFRGMDVTKYVKYINGVFRQMIKYLPRMISVTAYSQDAVSAKKTLMNIIKLRADHNSMFKEIELLTGVGLKPADVNFDDDYEVKKSLENFQEAMEKAYQALAKHICYINDYYPILNECEMDAAIGGFGMLEVYHHNGQIKWRRVNPVRAIFDSTKDDNGTHNNDDYAGEVYEMTIPELFNRWDWTKEEQDDLIHISMNISTWGVYNTFIGINGLYWWSQNNGVPRVTCVKGQWRSLEKRDGKWVEVLREGVLIGNKYLKDCKISEGQVWLKHDHSKKQLRYRVVTPDARLGAVVGIVGMIKRFQDLKDALTTKMINMAAAAIGKSYLINANKLPEGMRTPDVISQLKQSNIIVVEGVDIDETPDSKAQRLVEPIDMTVDPNVNLFLQQIQYWDNVIADILNIPPAARGQLNTYQSKDVVASSLSQSGMGMSWFYESLMTWIQGVLEYSANAAKLIMPESAEGKDSLALVVGDSNVEIFEMDIFKRMQFEDFLLTLDVNSMPDEEDKKWFKELAMQMASAGQFSMLDAAKMKQIDTVDGLVDYFELVERKKQMREEAMQQQQLAAAQQNALINSATQQDITNTQVQGKLDSEAMRIAAQQQQPPQQ